VARVEQELARTRHELEQVASQLEASKRVQSQLEEERREQVSFGAFLPFIVSD